MTKESFKFENEEIQGLKIWHEDYLDSVDNYERYEDEEYSLDIEEDYEYDLDDEEDLDRYLDGEEVRGREEFFELMECE